MSIFIYFNYHTDLSSMVMKENIVYFFLGIILLSCSPESEKSCNKCELFFAKSGEVFYPERKVLQQTQYSTNGGKGVVTNVRTFVLNEYEELQDQLFCFIGKNETWFSNYFKPFYFYPNFSYSVDSMQFIKETYVKEYRKKNLNTDNYEVANEHLMRFNFRKIDGEFIYVGNHQDSLNLKNCLEAETP